ncbi:MAG: 50S ribosomal protein L10 [bacterium]|nr:50S ribosomal protein L10 [bacterium]
MALTKLQKQEQIDLGLEKLKASANVVFADFNKVSVEDVKRLRRELKGAGAELRVIKKRLLKLAFQKMGLDFDPSQFTSQLATIFLPKDLSDFAASIYKFSKALERARKGEFKILGAYNLSDKQFVDANEFVAIAKLPSRDVLLAQIVIMLTMPIKQFMTTLNERAKRL